MAIPKHIKEFHNGINDLETELGLSTDRMLNAIDLDKLLKNPELYLTTLANLFLEQQGDLFKKAFDMGIDHGKKLIDGNS